jgi:hypothetical protein
MSYNKQTIRFQLLASVAVIAVGALLASSSSVHAAADANNIPAWNPKSSEKLIKLPATYLKKSLDHDFQESTLGLAIQKTEEKTGLKSQTLADLRDAIEEAEGELKLELRHQFLGEKRNFLELISEKNRYRKKHLRTKHRLFERMLKRMAEKNRGMTPVRQELVNRQEGARQRFKSSLAKVDMKLFQVSVVPESRYTVKYAENLAAIEKLASRIQSHRMNTSVQVDGQPLSKEDYIRQLLADAQAELAVLEQEETILGYMAKLVAFDALALSEQALDAEMADSDRPSASSPAKAVDYFLTN